MVCVCGQLTGVTLERNERDYITSDGGKIVADGVEQDCEDGAAE